MQQIWPASWTSVLNNRQLHCLELVVVVYNGSECQTH